MKLNVNFFCLAVGVAGSMVGLPRPATAADLYRNVLSGSFNTLTNINGWSTTAVPTAAAPSAVTSSDRLVFSNYWTPSLAGAAPALWINASNNQSVTASGGSISQISDLSGNARNATQGTAGNRPTYVTGSMNGLQVARFDGSNDFLNLVTFAQQSGQSIMTAVDTTNLQSGNRAFISRSVASGRQNAPAPYLRGTDGGADLRPASFWGGGGNVSDWRAGISNESSPARGPTIIDFGYSTSGTNGTATTRVNGGTSASTFAQQTAGGLGISENWTGISSSVQASGMDLGEVIIYSGAISTSDRQRTEAYFSGKWGIALDGSNNNPFANTTVRAENTTYLDGDHAVAGLLFSGTGTATTLLGGTSGGPASNSLTLGGDGIVINAGVLATTLGNASSGGVNLVVGADQAWTNNSSNALQAPNAISRAAGDTTSRVLTVAGSGITQLEGSIANGGASGVLGLTKTGSGPLILLGNSTFSGGSLLSAGTVVAASNAALGTGVVTLDGSDLELRGVTLANPMELTAGQTNLSVSSVSSLDVEYLIVAGGGGGASGGGGGGGVLFGSTTLSGTMPVEVGAGGAGQSPNSVTPPRGWREFRGLQGGNSSLGDVVAVGGGGGGAYGDEGAAVRTGGNGGSGGGGGGLFTNQTNAAGGSGVAGQGNNGGSSQNVVNGRAGGGGGAGQAGFSGGAAGSDAGKGGDGILNTITGSSLVYGGGGGGGEMVASGGASAGGAGGGGTGGFDLTVPNSGANGLGGGGGGGSYSEAVRSLTASAAGGSGIVIARYLGGPVATGGDIALGTGSAAGYTIHTFTATGTSAFALMGAPGPSTLSGNLTGVGGIQKTGSQILVLSGSSTYTGATTVNDGSLFVNGQLGNTAVTVNSGGLLGGSGSIAGSVSVLTGGTFSPGNSPGLLSVGSLDLAGTTIMEIDGVAPRGAAGGYDAANVTSLLTYGGSLLIDFGPGITAALADNTTFDLFAFGSYTGGFSTITTAADGSFYGGLSFASTGGGDKWTATKDSQSLEFTHSTGNLVIVPEPQSLALAGIGISAAAWALRRRRGPRR